MWIVPTLARVEDRRRSFVVILELVTHQQLALQCREETLVHRVLVATAHRSHGWSDAGFLTALAERDRCVLAALVGMVRMRLAKNSLDPITVHNVCSSSSRRQALAPCVIAARRDREHTAEHRNGVVGVVRVHESEDLFGTALLSRGN